MASRMKTIHERRRELRATEHVPLAITDAGAVLTTETKNLSASGAYCTLDRFIAPMSKLQLTFELPNGRRKTHIRCSGVVVRVEPTIANSERARYNIAVFFTELSDRDRTAIKRFVRERLSTTPSAT